MTNQVSNNTESSSVTVTTGHRHSRSVSTSNSSSSSAYHHGFPFFFSSRPSSSAMQLVFFAHEDTSESTRAALVQTATQLGYTTVDVPSLEQASSQRAATVVLLSLGDKMGRTVLSAQDQLAPVLEPIKRIVKNSKKQTFVVVHGAGVTQDPFARMGLTNCGANMVTDNLEALREALSQVAQGAAQVCTMPPLVCSYCGLCFDKAEALVNHVPLYHVNDNDRRDTCGICNDNVRQKSWPRHIHSHKHNDMPRKHGDARKKHHHVQKEDMPFASFALVLIRRPSDGKFLLVQEFSNEGYWMPGGHVDQGETLQQGGIREALEEVGVHVTLTGILSLEYMPLPTYLRITAVFLAEMTDPSEPNKTLPDFESVGSAWVSLEELKVLNKMNLLRGKEPLKWATYLTEGKPVGSMEILPDFGYLYTDVDDDDDDDD